MFVIFLLNCSFSFPPAGGDNFLWLEKQLRSCEKRGGKVDISVK